MLLGNGHGSMDQELRFLMTGISMKMRGITLVLTAICTKVNGCFIRSNITILMQMEKWLSVLI